MPKSNWKDVKDEIEREVDKIWWEEPDEISMARMGIFPSGAGTDGQYFANLFFLVADTRAMGFWTVLPTMQRVFRDPTFNLEHCKSIWKYTTLHMALFLGGKSSNGSNSYLNLSKLNNFCKKIESSLESVKTKEELESLIWSWGNYVNAIHKWLFLIFPWEIGKLMPRVDEFYIENVKELYTKNLTMGV